MPPLHGIKRNPPRYVDRTAAINKIYDTRDKIASEVEKMQAIAKFCVSDTVRKFVDEKYTKMTRQPTQTFTCVSETYNYVQRTDCQGVVSPGPVGHKIPVSNNTGFGGSGFGIGGAAVFNQYRPWVFQSDQRGVAHGC